VQYRDARLEQSLLQLPVHSMSAFLVEDGSVGQGLNVRFSRGAGAGAATVRVARARAKMAVSFIVMGLCVGKLL
jgi:hypothetical protein